MQIRSYKLRLRNWFVQRRPLENMMCWTLHGTCLSSIGDAACDPALPWQRRERESSAVVSAKLGLVNAGRRSTRAQQQHSFFALSADVIERRSRAYSHKEERVIVRQFIRSCFW